LGREDYPTEEEQFQIYKVAAERMAGKKVVIRTADLGGDKHAEYLGLEPEENPAMGCRGIRISLNRMEMFKTQLRGVYRAAAFGKVSLLFPMIISVEEVLKIKQICGEVRAELEACGAEYGEVELGIMVETPAAVMISDLLAKEVDFMSIGTNDLTQYTLAVDRGNANLDGMYDAHHTALLRMIRMVVENGHKEQCRVGVCGELASDTSLTEILLKMGVDELSVAPDMILPIRNIVINMNG
jgi:phosphotransferase system enzyme I (PtsI)